MRTLLLALWCACVVGCGGGGTDPGPGDGTPEGFPAFAFGVEYMEPGLAEAFGATGVRWAKTRLEAFEWNVMEPSAPGPGGPVYDWACADEDVRSYQRAGMRRLQSYLSPRSSWGSKSFNADIMPKPEFEAAYAAWVRALIERYDGDGIDDMPGLLAPIRFWVVGGEWTGFWPSGSAPDYLRLLEMTRTAARAADPDVQLGTIPFFLYDVFHGNEPTDAQIATRLANPNPVGRHTADGVLAILDRPDLFDYVNVHSLGDYTEIPPTLRWFRAQMAARGYDKPIWFDDAFPMSLLANLTWPIIYPLQSEAQRTPVLDVLRDVGNMTEPAYSIARAWVQGLSAKGTVQKVLTALGEGAVGIQIGNTEDWMHDHNAGLRVLQINLIGAAAMMGAIDVVHGDGSIPNYEHCAPRTVGAFRPAYHNLAMLAARLGDGRFDRIERLPLPAGGRGYAFHRDGTWWLAVWFEDDVLQMPGEVETPTNVTVTLPGAAASVDLTWAITQGDAPTTDTQPVVAGQVTLSLTSTPVFVAPSAP